MNLEERIKNVAGWLTLQEAEVLEHLARDQIVMEIGSYRGRSTVAMAPVAKKVICIDHFMLPANYAKVDETGRLILPDEKPNTRELFEKNVKPWRDKLEVHEMNSLEAVKLDWESVGLLFIDGGHDYETVKSDCGFLKWVTPGGHVAFHDTQWKGIAAALKEVMTDNLEWEKVESYWNIAVYRRLK